ncbi:MAG: glycosyltransferase family 2 protein [Pseudomonadota bacterium]
MKISIITVCFNAAGSIASTIQSVLAQDYPHKEMLIFDGGSTDGTQDVVAAILADMPDAPISFVSERDTGMYDALNKGLDRFTGDAVGALNADDTYHSPAVLSQIAATLDRAAIVHGDLDFVTDHNTKRVVRRWRVPEHPKGGFRAGWMPAHPTFYVRREVVDAVGRYDLSLKTASDYDFMLRAIELNDFSIAKVPGTMVDMMQGGRSTASLRSHVAHNLEALKARQKWLGAGIVDRALIAKPASKIGQFIGGR